MSFEKFKIHWVTQDHDLVGNALGYGSHVRMMKKYSEAYFEFDDSSEIALHIVPADKFYPIPNKFNILFTMWEAIDVPPSYKQNLPKADALITPCRFSKRIFRPYTDKQIEVCFEGVEPEKFKFHQRQKPLKGQKFRYLWVGAPNPRKGYGLVLQAIKIVEQLPNIEIYLKTTVPKNTKWQDLKILFKNWKRIVNCKDIKGEVNGWGVIKRTFLRIPRPSLPDKIRVMGKHKNIIFDTRNLPFDELIELYNSAHCFLLPSFGEGWGLTLCEAMATGAPCVATSNTGTADFFDEEVGFTLKYEEEEQEFMNYDFKGRVFVPDTADFIKRMTEVYDNYDEALKRGKKAHSRITTKFTWENSAKRLYYIVRKVTENVSQPVGV